MPHADAMQSEALIGQSAPASHRMIFIYLFLFIYLFGTFIIIGRTYNYKHIIRMARSYMATLRGR